MVNKVDFCCFFDKIRIFLIKFLLVFVGIFGIVSFTNAENTEMLRNIKIGDFTYTLENQTAYVTNYSAGFFSKLFGSMTIPEVVKYNGKEYSVKGIMLESSNTKIKNVTGNSVDMIYGNSFADWSALKEVTFLNAKYINSGVFKNCEKLTTVNLPTLRTVGENAFENCKNLKNVSLPKVTEINGNAFSGCESLQTIEVPNLAKYGENIFNGLPEGVTFKVSSKLKNEGLEKLSNGDKIKIEYVDGIANDKSTWGEKIINSGVINYVDDDGKTSAEVTSNGLVWLRETSGGTSAWYAIDNSNGTFKKGSRFWVKWLSPEVDSEEFNQYYNNLDNENKKKIKDNKLWVFLTGVTDPDGNEYTTWDNGFIDYYIQLGDDWGKEDIEFWFISEGKDSIVEHAYETMASPEGTAEFAKLSLKHFSPYVMLEKEDETSTSMNTSTSKSQTPTGLVEKTAILGFMFTASLLSIAVLNKKLKIFD